MTRLMTPEQHAQIMGFLEAYSVGALSRNNAESLALEALAILQALPEVEVVAFHEPHAYGNVTCYPAWAEANGWKPLYATKEST